MSDHNNGRDRGECIVNMSTASIDELAAGSRSASVTLTGSHDFTTAEELLMQAVEQMGFVSPTRYTLRETPEGLIGTVEW